MHTRLESLTTLAALALGTLPVGLAAQTRFEGVVTFKMEGRSGKTDTVTQTTRGTSMRLEGFGTHDGVWIYDGDQKRMIMVDGAQKKAMIMTEKDAEQMRAMREGMMQAHGAKTDADKPKVHFSKTGKTETVAGVKCEVWTGYTEYNGKKQEGEACLADGVGFAPFDAMTNSPMFGAQSAEWKRYRELVGPNKGLVKATEITDGKRRTSIEAIKIEKKSVSPSEFQPPAGYAVTDMGDMMRKAQEQMSQQRGGGKPPKP